MKKVEIGSGIFWRVINLRSIICIIISTLCIPSFTECQANESPNKKTQQVWTGHYLKKSELCTSPNSGNDCSDRFNDSLKIEKALQGYNVELYSTQASQNICSFRLHMHIEKEKLVYHSKYGPIVLQKNGETLEISSSGIDPTALGLGICGIHADIDGLKFQTSSKTELPLLRHRN